MWLTETESVCSSHYLDKSMFIQFSGAEIIKLKFLVFYSGWVKLRARLDSEGEAAYLRNGLELGSALKGLAEGCCSS